LKGYLRMASYFEKVKKNFGFGCMRLPMKDDEVDFEQFSEMIKMFLDNGFNYFDTAQGYIGGKSVSALKKCLTSRYPREDYILVNKLTEPYFNSEAEVRPFFEKQLESCGVEYFDFYLMHAQNSRNYVKFTECKAYETAFKLKEEGKIRHVGISFHDKAHVLERILTDHPDLEVVQLQFNYFDYDSESVESRKCLEVCQKYGKPVIVMEPVKGGTLVNLPADAQEILSALKGGSNASYAIRFAASFEGIMMVLSGMSNLEQMADNISYMKDFKPLTEEEHAAIKQVCYVMKEKDLIPCTSCRYCTEGCPMSINIPQLFSYFNHRKQNLGNYAKKKYLETTENGGKASECVSCQQCVRACPQNLNIPELLKNVAKTFE